MYRAARVDLYGAAGYFAVMPPHHSAVAGYHSYRFHHIDDHSFVMDPERVLDTDWGPSTADWPAFRAALEATFRGRGWEGDGDITAIWVPPFCADNAAACFGMIVWHVKQSNNGTSFLACEYPLPFDPIRQQN